MNTEAAELLALDGNGSKLLDTLICHSKVVDDAKSLKLRGQLSDLVN